MKHILIAVLVMVAGVAKGQTPVVQWDGPLVITQPGTYVLHNRGTHDQYAVWILGSAKNVKLSGYVQGVAGRDAIHVEGYVTPDISFVNFSHVDSGYNEQPGKAVFISKPRGGRIEHCEIQDQNGIFLQGGDEYVKDSFYIRYNKFRNISKVKPDGSVGGEHVHGVMLNSMDKVGPILIEWNEGINVQGQAMEDWWSTNETTTVDTTKYIRWRNNYAQGNLVYPISKTDYYSGSGLTTEGNSSNVIAESNQFVNSMNAGMNISRAPYLKRVYYYNNRIITAGVADTANPSFKSPRYWAGCSDYYWPADTSQPVNNKASTCGIYNNISGFVNWFDKSMWTSPNQQAELTNRGTGPYQNLQPAGQNTFLAYQPTKATEDSERYVIWPAKQKAAGVYVGITPPVFTAPVVTATNGYKLTAVIAGVTLTVDTTTGIVAGSIAMQNEDGKAITLYQKGSVVFISSNPGVATATPYATDETKFYITPYSSGTANISLSLLSHLGQPVKTDFSITVTQLYKPVTKLVITLQGAK